MKRSYLLAAGLAATLGIGLLSARTWTSADGTKKFEGDLRSYDKKTGKVTVTMQSGRPLTLDGDKLSDGDKIFLETHGAPAAVDTSTLEGKLMCGYQGWFRCEGDGAKQGWVHWGRGGGRIPGPGNVTVDLWPDLTGFDPDERYATSFRHANGRAAEVFSSHNRKTVLRHFRWMREYGIDGVFVQRFANELRSEATRHPKDVVLAHCREGARLNGRAYAVMYDLSGLRAGQVSRVQDDWRMLREKMKLSEDHAYLKHRGKPLVAVWGVGFGGDRRYKLVECAQLVAFLRAEGCSVMLGVPSGWRKLDRDAAPDPALHDLLKQVDVLSPWNVGRYRSGKEAASFAETIWRPDLAWCRQHKVDYLPTVYPGFSWHNLKGGNLNQIPRRKGEFLWSQFAAVRRVEAKMVYVAMFDEVDEGTAIFKCTNAPPVGKGAQFTDYEGLPSDYYLRLSGSGGRMLRREIPYSETIPGSPN
jgi:hypothetical protein